MHESIILKKTFADIVSVFFIISKILVLCVRFRVDQRGVLFNK